MRPTVGRRHHRSRARCFGPRRYTGGRTAPHVTSDRLALPGPRSETAVPAPVRGLVAGRFRAIRTLKSAHGVETLLAVDERDGREAILKSVPVDGLPTGARLRLEHEATVLSRLSGPGLSGLLDVGRDKDTFYLAMPLLPGETLAERLCREPLSTAETLVVAHDIATALQVAHAQGVLHRDVKPTNIIVDNADGGRVTAATLIDSGFPRSPQLDTAFGDEPVGTARYSSPEQAGLLH